MKYALSLNTSSKQPWDKSKHFIQSIQWQSSIALWLFTHTNKMNLLCLFSLQSFLWSYYNELAFVLRWIRAACTILPTGHSLSHTANSKDSEYKVSECILKLVQRLSGNCINYVLSIVIPPHLADLQWPVFQSLIPSVCGLAEIHPGKTTI